MKAYFSRFKDNLASKELPENIQISIITKRLKLRLISVVMPQYPPILEELMQAILLEQTQTVTQPKLSSVASVDSILTLKAPPIICSRRQFKILLLFQNNKLGMMFHENRLLADDSHEISFIISFKRCHKICRLLQL